MEQTPDTMNILVAEDHPTNQMIVRHHLERHHHRVTIATDGEQVLKQCEAQRFDLILMDIQMPKMDGIEATRRVRAGDTPNKNVPIIAVTASAEKAIRSDCMSAGMNDLVTKPLLFVRLLKILEKWAPSAPSRPLEETSAPAATDREESSEDPADAPLDYSTLLVRLDGDQQFAEVLLDGFCGQTETMLNEMTTALENGDMPSLRRLAHTIKGGALNIVADDLQSAAKALEETAKNHVGDADALVQQIKSEYRRLKHFVDSERG